VRQEKKKKKKKTWTRRTSCARSPTCVRLLLEPLTGTLARRGRDSVFPGNPYPRFAAAAPRAGSPRPAGASIPRLLPSLEHTPALPETPAGPRGPLTARGGRSTRTFPRVTASTRASRSNLTEWGYQSKPPDFPFVNFSLAQQAPTTSNPVLGTLPWRDPASTRVRPSFLLVDDSPFTAIKPARPSRLLELRSERPDRARWDPEARLFSPSGARSGYPLSPRVPPSPLVSPDPATTPRCSREHSISRPRGSQAWPCAFVQTRNQEGFVFQPHVALPPRRGSWRLHGLSTSTPATGRTD